VLDWSSERGQHGVLVHQQQPVRQRQVRELGQLRRRGMYRGGGGTGGADNCVGAEVLPTCSASCTSGAAHPGGTNPGASACWCTNNNQCASGSCANWSGCAAGVCTGAAGTGGADNCVQVPAPTCVATASSYSCPVGVAGGCNASNTCQCTTDAQCGTGGKCVSWSGCAAGACTGSGTPSSYGCQQPAVAIPPSCTQTIPYSCTVGQCNASGTAVPVHRRQPVSERQVRRRGARLSDAQRRQPVLRSRHPRRVGVRAREHQQLHVQHRLRRLCGDERGSLRRRRQRHSGARPLQLHGKHELRARHDLRRRPMHRVQQELAVL